MPQQFRDAFYNLTPPWLQTGNAEKYLYVLELMRDCLMEKCSQAVKIRFPGLGDPSQLPYLAFDRALVQGPAEPNANFVTRLQTAFPTWAEAGSAPAVLKELQAYIQELQPGVAAANPQLAIVSNRRDAGSLRGSPASPISTWNVLYQNTPLGAPPVLATVPFNFNWDGSSTHTWRAWLIIYLAAVATGQSGSAAATSTASGGSFTNPGHNVGGVWVPQTSGTAVNAPFLTITGLTGILPSNVGNALTISGSAHSGNNGTFQIVEELSSTSCVIANPNGVASDAGPLTWSIAAYPWIGPSPALGSPGIVWGHGQSIVPPKDTGSNVGGVWQPNSTIASGTQGTISWGLNCNADVVQALRALVKAWKSGGTYYPHLVFCFAGGNGTAGNEFSPYSSSGSGNPDGTFGSPGKNVNGVWVPTRQISSPWDAYARGTGVNRSCGIENVT